MFVYTHVFMYRAIKLHHRFTVMRFQGDSGGPLMCKEQAGLWILRGVVSFGTEPCVGASSNRPTIFSNVFYFMNWTQSVMQIFT